MPRSLLLAALVCLAALPGRAEDTPGTGAHAASSDTATADTERCQIAVLTPTALGLGENEAHIPALLADSVASEIEVATSCHVLTQNDIRSMIDFEANRIACGAEGNASCLAELGGALGVSRVVTGTVGRLGESFKLTLTLQNVDSARVEARFDQTLAGSPETLDAEARRAARSLFVQSAGIEPILLTGGALLGAGVVVSGAGVISLALAAWGANDTGSPFNPAIKGVRAIGPAAVVVVGWTLVAASALGVAVGATGTGMLAYSLIE